MSEWSKFPESKDDLDGFKDFIVNCLEENTRQHGDLLHSAYQNVLANYGIQWIVYDNQNRTFRPRALKRWVPRPVTNKFNVVLRPIISSLASAEPSFSYIPVSDVDSDVQSAFVAGRLLDIAREESKVLRLRPELGRWLALTGNGWLVNGYDKNPRHGTISEPLERCVACQAVVGQQEIEEAGGCPECIKAGRIGGEGSDTPGMTAGFGPAMGEDGRRMMTERARGSMFSEVASIFEIEYDHEAKTFAESPYKIRVTSKPKRLMQEQFDLDEIGASPSSLISQRYLESLAFIAPTSQQWVFGRYGSGEDRTVVIEGWIEPCEKFPDGLYGTIVGEKVVGKLVPFPYHDMTGYPTSAITHFGYEFAPGRVAYRSPADDLLQLQRERNELQSILILHSKRAANSIWLIPDTANMSKTTGEEGVTIKYTPLSNTPPPSRQPGLNPPSILIERMSMIDMEMESIAGAMDVLRGEAPKGVKAYAAIESLEQQAKQNLAEPYINWANGWGCWSEQMLGIFKEFGVDARTHTYLGENGMWAMKKFTNADLRGALQIKADAGLNKPTSHASRRATYEQGIRLGLTNPADPAERYKGWEILGMPEMMKDNDLDLQHVAKENDAWISVFVKGEKPDALPMVNPEIDNHMIHITGHRRFCLSDNFTGLRPEAKTIILAHIGQHKMALAQEQMAAMASQAPGAVEGNMRNTAPKASPSEGEMATAEGGASSQPARANALMPQ
jgi:hypothetical protein